MKYLYIFKQKNGERIAVEEHIAYEICYEQEERTRATFLGRVDESEFRRLHPQMIRDVREYKKELTTPQVLLAIDDSNISGGVSEIELDFTAKTNIKAKELETKFYDALLEKSDKVMPDSSLNEQPTKMKWTLLAVKLSQREIKIRVIGFGI